MVSGPRAVDCNPPRVAMEAALRRRENSLNGRELALLARVITNPRSCRFIDAFDCFLVSLTKGKRQENFKPFWAKLPLNDTFLMLLRQQNAPNMAVAATRETLLAFLKHIMNIQSVFLI